MKKRDRMKPRVVAVDDDEDFLRVIRLMLEPRYEVECFSSGAGLLGHMDALRPDAVILDVHMPEADGFALCRSIRSRPGCAGLPVLFLTASREDDDFVKTLQAGGDAWINKPVGRQALHDRLRDLLSVPSDGGSWVERS